MPEAKKAIIDTNVLVSALIQRNYPYHIVNHLIGNSEIEWCISHELFTEYYEVLHRQKFAKYADFVSSAEQVLAYVEQMAVKYKPTKILDILSDEADNRLLELADVSNADYLVTGNTNDFIMNAFNNTQIISAKDFWLIIAP